MDSLHAGDAREAPGALGRAGVQQQPGDRVVLIAGDDLRDQGADYPAAVVGLPVRPGAVTSDRLATIAPVAGSKIFFTSGGSDSVDTAVKLARRYWQEAGKPTKTLVIGREKAYHGMHVAGTALAGIPGNHEGYGELMAHARTIEWDSGKSLLEAIQTLGAETIGPREAMSF